MRDDPNNGCGGDYLATGLDAFLSSFSTSQRCPRNRSPSRLPVSPMYNFLQRVQVMQQMALVEVHVKRSVILMDRLVPDIFLMTCFASCACAFKSSGLVTCLECTSD